MHFVVSAHGQPLWVSTNEHFQINTKPLCLSGLSYPSMSSKNVKLLWNDFVLMRPSPFVHIQSHLTEQWQKEDAIASCCCRTCKNSIAWGLGVQCGLLGTRWMLLCHTSQGTEITEVEILKNLKTCVAQGIKALLCCCSVPWLLRTCF